MKVFPVLTRFHNNTVVAVFSSREKAEAWISKKVEERDYYFSVRISPFYVGRPVIFDPKEI